MLELGCWKENRPFFKLFKSNNEQLTTNNYGHFYILSFTAASFITLKGLVVILLRGLTRTQAKRYGKWLLGSCMSLIIKLNLKSVFGAGLDAFHTSVTIFLSKSVSLFSTMKPQLYPSVKLKFFGRLLKLKNIFRANLQANSLAFTFVSVNNNFRHNNSLTRYIQLRIYY